MNEHVENHWGFIGFSTEKRLTDEETLAEGRRLFGQLKLAASQKQVKEFDRELTNFLVLHNLELSPEETKEREALFAKWDIKEGEKEAQPSKEQELSDERLARAIMGCQVYFWGNSAYAVLFCLLRDEYGMADKMSQFEAKVEQLPYGGKRSYTCPKGTLANAFSDNPIYKQPVGKWNNKASTRIQKLLEEFRLQLEL